VVSMISVDLRYMVVKNSADGRDGRISRLVHLAELRHGLEFNHCVNLFDREM
jgi:hypothetical protein